MDGAFRLITDNGEVSGDKISVDGPVDIRFGGSSGEEARQPLIFVDGELKGRSREVLAEINPDDIHRIEVIKGAAAAAIYGEDAADGVIQIFLKK